MLESKSIPKILDATEAKFNQIAPTSLNYQAERGFALRILAGNDYLNKIAKESPVSLQQAITSVAAIGLSLNPAECLAYLITRSVKVSNSKFETRVFLEPSYMGFVRLATDSGSMSWAQALIVYSNDTFTDHGPGERPTHDYRAFDPIEKRGEFVGVYCLAKTSEGDFLTTTMTKEEVYSIRDRSEAWKAKQCGPWKTDFGEMAKKSVVRRAFKMWPRTNTNQMTDAVYLSNENEGFEPILTSPEIKDFTGDQKSYFDQLITDSSALSMFAFQQTLDEVTFTNLYHSFEKGTKGKYQRIVDELLKSGRERCDQVTLYITEAATKDDHSAIQEIHGELSAEELDFIASRLSLEVNMAVQEITSQKGD